MTKQEQKKMLLAVRIRGAGRIESEIEKTFELLGLRYKYNAILLSQSPTTAGMLQKVKDHITWGEIDKKTLTKLLIKRGQVKGKGKIDPNYIKAILNFKGADEMADAILNETTSISLLTQSGLRKVFRLHPPRGGFKYSSKRPFKDRGELGYRGEAINKLVDKMI
ncbi:50S ribosomal protein L30 [[Eubacterium] cellulosolvens]